MLRTPTKPTQTQAKEATANTLLLNKKVFKIPAQNVRDAVIEIVRTQMPGTAFASPFITHLTKMGRKALDKYDDLEIALEEHHVILRFQCAGRTDGEAMCYTIDRLASEPNEAFQGKSWTNKLKFWG
jgi:hypothetical protein